MLEPYTNLGWHLALALLNLKWLFMNNQIHLGIHKVFLGICF